MRAYRTIDRGTLVFTSMPSQRIALVHVDDALFGSSWTSCPGAPTIWSVLPTPTFETTILASAANLITVPGWMNSASPLLSVRSDVITYGAPPLRPGDHTWTPVNAASSKLRLERTVGV